MTPCCRMSLWVIRCGRVITTRSILDEESTLSGRLDGIDYVGIHASEQAPVTSDASLGILGD